MVVAPVTIITPTIPERADLFAEMAVDMACQTVPPAEWLVHWDADRVGPSVVCNMLADRAVTEWVVPTGDDDRYDPTFVETLMSGLADDVDVVWPLCRVEGARPWWEGRSEFDPELLRRDNYIPGCAAIRTELWCKVGGYQDPPGQPHEDWDLWHRCLDAGARFRCVPIVCWTYRFGPWPRRSLGQL